ncbi:LOW QUALITY PROTEIN: serine/threonine-protein kinase atr-like [Artemia franciscana]|uniref:LOW QUALITY PROTEIN: serine/threonine-protein kinase atr-like n=1 Tax=Artemia franciscana TaxID=6661 RepID=UPI0032DA9284
MSCSQVVTEVNEPPAKRTHTHRNYHLPATEMILNSFHSLASSLAKDSNNTQCVALLRLQYLLAYCAVKLEYDIDVSSISVVAAENISKILKICDSAQAFSDIISPIIDVVSALSVYHMVKGLPQQLLSWVVAMMTLPWMVYEVNFLDLVVEKKAMFEEMARLVDPLLDVNMKLKFFKLLSRTCIDVAPQWRLKCLKYAKQELQDQNLSDVVGEIPWILYCHQSGSIELVLDIVRSSLETKNTDVLLSFVQVAPPSICSLSKTSFLAISEENIMGHILLLRCRLCFRSEDKKTCHIKNSKTQGLTKEIVKIYMTIFKSNMPIVTECGVSIIPRLATHLQDYGIYDLELIHQTFALFNNTNKATQLAVADVLKSLLYNMNSTQKRSRINESRALIVEYLEEMLTVALSQKESNKLCIVLAAVESLCQSTDDYIRVQCCHFLFRLMVTSENVVSSNAQHILRSYFKQSFVREHYQELFSTVAESITDERSDETKSIQRLIEVLDGKSVEESEDIIRVELVPLLVIYAAKGNRKSISLLKNLPNLLSTVSTFAYMLRDGFPVIWSRVILCHSRSEADQVETFLHSNGFRLNEMRASTRYLLTYQLMIQNAMAPHRVLEELAYLASLDSSGKLQHPVISIAEKDKIAENVQIRFLGVLEHLMQKFGQPMPRSLKITIFQSFPGMFKILGPRIVSLFHLKIFSTLRVALKNMDGLHEDLVNAWDSFVRHLLPSALPDAMMKVIASLWPYKEVLSNGIHKIMRFLVLDASSATDSCIYQLGVLDGLDDYPDIASVVKSKQHSHNDLKGNLNNFLLVIENDDDAVRTLGLLKLRLFLRERAIELQDLVLNADTGDALVSKLVITLCAKYQEAGEESKCLFAECLGLVGAIEPSRICLGEEENEKPSLTVYDDVTSEEFAFELFNKLYIAFLQSVSTQITTFSYTIQELLKTYNIDPEYKSTMGRKLWSKMSEHQQSVFRPFLSTMYKVVEKNPAPKTRIVFGSKLVNKHSNWICMWVEEMVSHVKSEFPKKVFSSVVPALKKSSTIQIFLVPHVVVQLILEDTQEATDQLCDEITAVISHNSACPASILTIFLILDHLNSLLSAKESAVAPKKNQTTQELLKRDPSYQKIRQFVERIADEKLAESAARAGAFARAVKHLESYLMKHPDQKEKKAAFLQELYVSLDETDGVIGAAALVPKSSVDVTIRTYEAIGDYQSAIAALRAKLCNSNTGNHESNELEMKERIAKCYLELNQPDAVLEFLKCNPPEEGPYLREYKSEALWRLGNWQGLDEINREETCLSWGDCIGVALLAGKKEDFLSVNTALSVLETKILDHMTVATFEKGWYQRAYPDVAKLAVVVDLRMALDFISSMVSRSDFNIVDFFVLLKSWSKRREITQTTVRVLEPMMNVQRVALKLIEEKVKSLKFDVPSALEAEMAANLSSCIRLARKVGQSQRALSYILEAECTLSILPPKLMLEKVKWQWMCGRQSDAIKELQTGISFHFPDVNQLKADKTISDSRRLAAESKLLLAKYMDATDSLDFSGLVALYKEAVAINQTSEESLFEMGLFYDRTYHSQEDRDKSWQYLNYTCNYLAKSLEHGSSFIYRSLPRFLSIWLDLGARVCEMPESNARLNCKKVLSQVNDLTKNVLAKRLPTYKLLTALSQMLSRTCHPNPDVWDALKILLAKTLRDYPQQSVWQMMVMMKSTQKSRSQRCAEIAKLACENKPELSKFISDAVKLTEKLIEIAETKFDGSTFSINSLFKELPKMLSSVNFSQIILPVQSNMTETLPTMPGSHKDFVAFPNKYTFIIGMDDEVEVLASLQRPKKFKFVCSDGKKYSMMAKPKDDLRKDARVMEFNRVVNRLLRGDTETRRRDLYIRTYSVVALNEETGLVEWLPNLHGIRPILLKLYANRGFGGSEYKKYIPGLKDTVERKKDLYRALCARLPPCLGDWFLHMFQDAKAWLVARHNYVRTSSVISLVGFILGLGDRHGENILIDSMSGDVCHVDYNCLFNKGETFEWPERVPFRLTRNLIHAMGVTGVEGVFRQCSEATMRVMRTESDTLLTVLRPLVHDPLVEWSKAKKASVSEDREFKSEKAMEVVRNIELRLQGVIVSRFRKSSQKLSIEGQVNQLILEASSEENLCQMYFGWAPYF